MLTDFTKYNTWHKTLLALVLFISVVYLSYVPAQSDFNIIFACYFLAFLSYYFLIRKTWDEGFFLLIALGILIRCILCFSFPNLSDDVYRFIWDGRLIHAGINPYSMLPTEALSKGIPEINQNLFENLNSQEYYTIYPPASQVLFYLSTFHVFSISKSVIVMKLCMLAAEITSLLLLTRLLESVGINKYNVLWYALNPLVITELCGNLHFEGFMICFILAGVYFLQKKKHIGSAICFSLAIATKLIPLIFLPFLWFAMKGKARNVFFATLFISLAILFFPVISGFQLLFYGESIDLYFQKFEFNASIYYLLRAVGFHFSGYNLIHYLGPGLAVISTLIILTLALKNRSEAGDIRNIALFGLLALSFYYFCSTTIHPWYVSTLVMVSVFTRSRFAFLWSMLITLTYINYSYVPYHENLWIVALEYALVFVLFIWEWKNGKLSFSKI